MVVAEWNAMTVAGQLEHMLSRSLDDCYAILDYPIEDALKTKDAVILNAKIQTIRAVLHCCTKLGIERSRVNSERERVLEAMAADLRQ